MNVEAPDRASFLAHLVARTLAHPERLSGSYAISTGRARTYIYDGKVSDTPPPRVDASIEAPLSVLAGVIADGAWLGPYLRGHLRRSGSILKTLELLRAFRR